MGSNERAWGVGFKRLIGDESLGATYGIGVDNINKQLHIFDIADVATDWTLSAATDPTLYIHCEGSNAVTDYVSIYHDDTNGIIACDGTAILTMTSTTLAISVDTTIEGDLVVSAEDISLIDDQDLEFGTGTDVLMRFSTADDSNHCFVIALDDTSQQMHITDKDAVATDWTRSAGTHPELCIHSNTTPLSDYLAIGNHDGTTAYIDVVGGTTLNLDIAGTTELAVSNTAVTIGSNNLSVAQGSYIYFDGQGGGEQIRAPAAGNLTITSSGTGNAAINLVTGSYTGNIQCYGYLRLRRTDTDGALESEMWYDDSENLIKYYSTGVRTLVDEESSQAITGQKNFNNAETWIGTSGKLHFRESGTYIQSPSANNITITSAGTGNAAINLVTGGPYTGTIQMYGYVRLLRTDTDGSLESQLWYDDSENRLKFYGASVVTVADLTNANVFTGQCDFNNAETWIRSNNKLIFRSADYHIQSPAANQLTITSAGTGNAAINLVTGGYTGNIQCYGFLRLLRTGSVGSNEGEVWYDTVSNKIHFWNGTAEQEVTSAGA